MHTIRPADNGGWMVVFLHPSSIFQYKNIARCSTPHLAGLVASWLNGGEFPGNWDDKDIEYLP